MTNQPISKRHIGFQGELLAQNYLEQQGYSILKANYYQRYGEIDLIALQDKTLVFLEVKFRHSQEFGSPLEAITVFKQQRLIRMATSYLSRYPHHGPIRFDVLGITKRWGQCVYYELIPNAIESDC